MRRAAKVRACTRSEEPIHIPLISDYCQWYRSPNFIFFQTE